MKTFLFCACTLIVIQPGCGSDTTAKSSATSATPTAAATADPNGAAATTPAASGSTTVPTTSVQIVNYAFEPNSATIAAGSVVAFTNQDPASHDMAVQAGETMSADSGIIAQGTTRSIAFPKAGTYTLYCTIHPSMTMTITVQ